MSMTPQYSRLFHEYAGLRARKWLLRLTRRACRLYRKECNRICRRQQIRARLVESSMLIIVYLESSIFYILKIKRSLYINLHSKIIKLMTKNEQSSGYYDLMKNQFIIKILKYYRIKKKFSSI